MTVSIMESARKILQAYTIMSRPLCRELKIPHTAFDILMFLANNPKYSTARDIVEVRGIKANLVSVNVDKLVNEGYLERTPISNDRRKTRLSVTEKALPIITRGRQMQEKFWEGIFENIDEASRETLKEIVESLAANADHIVKGWK